ncbi:hypothetical protein QAD02_011953 [Eretmocerus hayati]|uniref:Uncharacterized protein n=2 Tax=Eretmocerus hayati TaxID=131215 RepID=A0ACC2NY86_9HYME|nr:hypothetical protein QAD02_011946 [Eretmocerus hayati]KAJ8676167.1 hypothetical protein QAD02_011953 [Eretmocerus hayati]
MVRVSTRMNDNGPKPIRRIDIARTDTGFHTRVSTEQKHTNTDKNGRIHGVSPSTASYPKRSRTGRYRLAQRNELEKTDKGKSSPLGLTKKDQVEQKCTVMNKNRLIKDLYEHGLSTHTNKRKANKANKGSMRTDTGGIELIYNN